MGLSFALWSLFWSCGETEALSGFLAEVMALKHCSTWELQESLQLLFHLSELPNIAGAEGHPAQGTPSYTCRLPRCLPLPPATPWIWTRCLTPHHFLQVGRVRDLYVQGRIVLELIILLFFFFPLVLYIQFSMTFSFGLLLWKLNHWFRSEFRDSNLRTHKQKVRQHLRIFNLLRNWNKKTPTLHHRSFDKLHI